jgi:hypothetical protein
VAAGSRTNAILGAVLTTTNRFGTAVRSGDQEAAHLQSSASVILAQELSDAVGREHAVDLRAVTALKARGALRVPTRSDVGRIAHALASRRKFSDFARRYLGTALTPKVMARELQASLAGDRLRRFDLERLLNDAPSSRELRARAGEVRPPDVTLVVDALAARGLIGATLHGTLTDSLAGLEAAGSAAARRVALARLATVTAPVPGEPGAFLRAAAEALGQS